MKMNLLKKIVLCIVSVAFMAGTTYAGTNVNTGNNAAKNSAKKEQKKDKTTQISWIGTITISKDAAGNQTASFQYDQDMQQYTIQIDDSAKKILENFKTADRVQIKGTYYQKADGTAYIKLTEGKITEEKAKPKAK